MTESSKTVLFVVCVLVIAVGVLGVLAVAMGSDWNTFLPDLIIGLVTAGGIAGLIAFAQVQLDIRRARESEATRAYEGLVEALGDLQLASLDDRDTVRLMSRVGVKMIAYSELNDQKYPELAVWFEAERRKLRQLALDCGSSIESTDGPITIELKSLPFRNHLNGLVNNVRLWHRSPDAVTPEIVAQSERLEAELRAAGHWDDARSGT